MGIGLVILMASTVSILVSSMEDNKTGTPKSVDYFWPQPKAPEDFINLDSDKDVLSNNGGVAADKEGGAANVHIEQYPDKPIKTVEASEATQSSM